jgi:hypothetical protein
MFASYPPPPGDARHKGGPAQQGHQRDRFDDQGLDDERRRDRLAEAEQATLRLISRAPSVAVV